MTDLRMKNLTLVLLSLFFTFQVAEAQQYRRKHSSFEMGVMLGATSYSGDLTEKVIAVQEIQPGYGAFLRYHFNRRFAVRGHLYSGAISGDDKNNPSLKFRSFKFGTSIFEVGGAAEINLWPQERYSRTGIHRFNVSPYLYIGGGLTIAHPEAEYYGPPDKRNENLRVPLPEDNIKSNFLIVPMGGGLSFDFSERLVVGAELGWRPVFSDDLDGIAINGNPKEGDWYYFLGLTASFIFVDKSRR